MNSEEKGVTNVSEYETIGDKNKERARLSAAAGAKGHEAGAVSRVTI